MPNKSTTFLKNLFLISSISIFGILFFSQIASANCIFVQGVTVSGTTNKCSDIIRGNGWGKIDDKIEDKICVTTLSRKTTLLNPICCCGPDDSVPPPPGTPIIPQERGCCIVGNGSYADVESVEQCYSKDPRAIFYTKNIFYTDQVTGKKIIPSEDQENKQGLSVCLSKAGIMANLKCTWWIPTSLYPNYLGTAAKNKPCYITKTGGAVSYNWVNDSNCMIDPKQASHQKTADYLGLNCCCDKPPTTSCPTSTTPICFTPQVTIPGTKFEAKVPVCFGSNANFVFDYISGFYDWSVKIMGILVAVMMMIGGIMYIGSAGNSKTASTAKSMIISAFSAMLLLLFSYLLLQAVNPNLIKSPNLDPAGIACIPVK